MKYTSIISLTILLIACSPSSQENETPDSNQAPPVQFTSKSIQLNENQIAMADIKLGSLQKTIVSDYVECNGTISLPPQNIVSVNAPMGGFVEKINFLPGDYVKKGALLATLSHPDYISLQQNYLETKSRLTFARQEYERQKTLSEGDASARKRLEETTANYKSLEAQLMGISAQLTYIGLNPERIDTNGIRPSIALHSPINGHITTINVNRGKFVDSQEVMYELIDKSHLHLDLNVFEQDIAKVSAGQRVSYSLNKNGEQTFQGNVSLIGQQMEEENRAFSVHVDVDSPEDYFKPGMYVNARIFLEADSVPALPQTALIREQDNFFVFVKEDSGFVRKSVKTGAQLDGMTQVLNSQELQGLPIVVDGAYYLKAETE